MNRNVAHTVVEEELSANPQDAVSNYEAIIADFDHQRENAAQAVFRLGETYRKLGRLEEARVQFARILREFVDFPELARLSQQQLVQNASREGTIGNAANPPAAPSAEERTLLEEELSLLDQQLERAQYLVKSGSAPDSSLFPIQRDILHLKQQLARLSHASDNAAVREVQRVSVPKLPGKTPPAVTPQPASDTTPIPPPLISEPRAGAQ